MSNSKKDLLALAIGFGVFLLIILAGCLVAYTFYKIGWWIIGGLVALYVFMEILWPLFTWMHEVGSDILDKYEKW